MWGINVPQSVFSVFCCLFHCFKAAVNVLFPMLCNSSPLSYSASENNLEEFCMCRLLNSFIVKSGPFPLKKNLKLVGLWIEMECFKLKGCGYCRRNSSAQNVNLAHKCYNLYDLYFANNEKNVCFTLVSHSVNSKCSNELSVLRSKVRNFRLFHTRCRVKAFMSCNLNSTREVQSLLSI